MPVTRTVKIDAFPDSAFRHLGRGALVCVDVIDACTTAVTALAQARRTCIAADASDANELCHQIKDALLLADPTSALPRPGALPLKSEDSTSPVALSRRADRRPVVLLDPPGTRLLANCAGGADVYLACLRNLAATAEFLASRHDDVVLLGAGYGSNFRCEDQLVAARIGRALLARGFDPEDPFTRDVIARWGSEDVSLLSWGRSAGYLRRLGRSQDVAFILGSVDDLPLVCRYEDREVVPTDARVRVPARPLVCRYEDGEVVSAGTRVAARPLWATEVAL
jgi:phosphosulfolactate phosphohydrolase-like enzyme